MGEDDDPTADNPEGTIIQRAQKTNRDDLIRKKILEGLNLTSQIATSPSVKRNSMTGVETYPTKTEITINCEGPCQFCGSPVRHGFYECYDHFNRLQVVLGSPKHNFLQERFLSTDAMALQHCEVHGNGSNLLQLTRLYLMIEKNVTWDHSKTSKLSFIINQYKSDHLEILSPRPLKTRGRHTVIETRRLGGADDFPAFINRWSKEVFEAYHEHHDLCAYLASLCLKHFPAMAIQ